MSASSATGMSAPSPSRKPSRSSRSPRSAARAASACRCGAEPVARSRAAANRSGGATSSRTGTPRWVVSVADRAAVRTERPSRNPANRCSAAAASDAAASSRASRTIGRRRRSSPDTSTRSTPSARASSAAMRSATGMTRAIGHASRPMETRNRSPRASAALTPLPRPGSASTAPLASASCSRSIESTPSSRRRRASVLGPTPGICASR